MAERRFVEGDRVRYHGQGEHGPNESLIGLCGTVGMIYDDDPVSVTPVRWDDDPVDLDQLRYHGIFTGNLEPVDADPSLVPELKPMTTAEVLADLRARLNGAVTHIYNQSVNARTDEQSARLRAKADGVRLALSYLDEVTQR